MTDTSAMFRNEGGNAFPTTDTGEKTPAGSQPETTETDTAPSTDGPNNSQPDSEKDLPFHEHPRWKQRETEWNERFNEQEKRHTSEIEKIRTEFSPAPRTPAPQSQGETEIPSWFGGDQDQWNAYQKAQEDILSKATKAAMDRIRDEQAASEKQIKEANDYLQSELSAIESDKDLNPTGVKVDANKLLKTVLDNDLIDSKGRWNYRAGFRLMQANPSPQKPTNSERKAVAAATTSEPKPDGKSSTFKTAADFKENRPW